MSEAGQLDRKKRMLEALEESYGIVTRAAQLAEVPRSTFYEWMNTDPDFKASVEAVNESAIDFVESKLFERINGVVVQTGEVDGEPITYKQPPSDTAMIFYLKCKAKKRGYVERFEQDVTVKGGILVNFTPAANCDPMQDESSQH